LNTSEWAEISLVEGQIFVNGVNIAAMSRDQKLSLLGSIYGIFSLASEEMALPLMMFAEQSDDLFSSIRKNAFYRLPNCDSFEEGENSVNRRTTLSFLKFSETNGIRISDEFGDFIDDANAGMEQIDFALKDALKTYHLFKLVVQKAEHGLAQIKAIDADMMKMALGGKMVDVSNVE